MKATLYPVLSFLLLIMIACNNGNNGGDDPGKSTPIISYSVGATFPHDTSSFTQGLEFYNGILLEGTGNLGKSKLLQTDLQTGRILKQVPLGDKFFGEGITVLNDTLYQLTYKEGVVFVYNAKDFIKIREFSLKGEGWGITNDGKQLIVSNGSSNLFFYDPGTFKLLRELPVTENGIPAVNINELEYIKGFVYANQWQYNYILKIDPATGAVVAKLDLSDVVNRVRAKIPNFDEVGATLNGIAYNPQTGKVYVTGKLWPEIYEIQFPL